MRQVITIILFSLIFTRCSNDRQSHDQALRYYIEIGVPIIQHGKSYDEFRSGLAHFINRAQNNNPQRLDDIGLDSVRQLFKKYYDSHIVFISRINSIKDIDKDFPIKEFSIKHARFEDSIVKDFEPHFLRILEVGKESVDDNYINKHKQFSDAVNEEKKESSRIDKLCADFLFKYKIKNTELEQYGL